MLNSYLLPVIVMALIVAGMLIDDLRVYRMYNKRIKNYEKKLKEYDDRYRIL